MGRASFLPHESTEPVRTNNKTRIVELDKTEKQWLERAQSLCVDVADFAGRRLELATIATAAGDALTTLLTAIEQQLPAVPSKPGQRTLPGVEGGEPDPAKQKPPTTPAEIAAQAAAVETYKGWHIIQDAEGLLAIATSRDVTRLYLAPRDDGYGAKLQTEPVTWKRRQDVWDFITLFAADGPATDPTDRVTFIDQDGEIHNYSLDAAAHGQQPHAAKQFTHNTLKPGQGDRVGEFAEAARAAQAGPEDAGRSGHPEYVNDPAQLPADKASYEAYELSQSPAETPETAPASPEAGPEAPKAPAKSRKR